MNNSYLVQILVPKETGKGEPVSKEWFNKFLKELTDEFGGATSFIRAPGEGLCAAAARPNGTASWSSRS